MTSSPFQNAQPNPGGTPSSFRDFIGLRLGKTDKDFQSIVDFVVPDLQRDRLTGMYLTMALARRHPSPLVQQIYVDVNSHMDRVVGLLTQARAGSQVAEREVKNMLTLPEANELAMGYTRNGYAGNGLTGQTVDQVYRTLYRIPELAEMAVEEPDVLTFIPSISLDRMSDLVATVAKLSLIRFTKATAARYKFDGKLVIRPVRNVWNSQTNSLGRVRDTVLENAGRTLLLVPKHIVRSAPPMRAEQYANFIGTASMTKEEVLSDIVAHPGRLKTFVREVLADEWRFRSRREFRD